MADDSLTNIADEKPGSRKISKYIAEIELYDKETQKWDRQSKSILKRYKDDRGSDGNVALQERRFNVLWSNTQNLLPALYAHNPKPDIQRRFKDADPIGRVTSDILERCAAYFCDTDHFAATSRQCVLDYLLPGRGVQWCRYVPHFKPAEEITDDIAPGDDNDGEKPEAPEVIDYEDVIPDYVHRADFGYNIGRTWDEVWLVWRKVYMDRPELKARFKSLSDDEIAAIPMDYAQKDLEGRTIDDGVSKSVIYEAWDKRERKALWFHKSIPSALDERPDPLGLENFFPCPKPLFTNLANDSLIPVPDYVEYQDQAYELDSLTARIAQITKNLKVAGIYDGSAEGLERLFNEGTENELIPIQNWAGIQEKGGLDNSYSLIPLKDIAAALLSLYEARDKVKQDLDEITGMSDIIRGNTDASETASAQKLKAGYANQRISDRQREVQRFIRETIRIMVDIIANHFQIETIKQISGVRLLTQQEKTMYSQQPVQGAPSAAGVPPPSQPPPLPPNVTPEQLQDMLTAPSWEEVEALIRNKAMRCFRIDIETDSTIKADEEADKASRIEFIKAIGEYMASALPAAEQTPELIPVLAQGLMFLCRGFPIGKEMEGTLNAAMQKLEKAAQNPQRKPNPEMAKVQGELQLQGQKQQADMQMANQQAQDKIKVAQAEQEAQAAQAAQENQLEAQREHAKLQSEERLSMLKMQTEGQNDMRKALLDAKVKIIVARITAKDTDGTQEQADVDVRFDDLFGPVKDTELHSKMDAILEHLGRPQPVQSPPPDLSGPLNNLAQAHHALASTLGQAHQQTMQAHAANANNIQNLHQAVTAEKEIVRDKAGKPTGVRVKKPSGLSGQLRH